MAKLIGWKVYYDNESTFSSLEGSWGDAPCNGIQVLVEFYEDGTKKLHVERDYYILDDGKAYGTNNIHPYLDKQKVIKFGRWSSDDKFKALVERAKKENL